jgi:hypothetical protein
MNGRFRTINGRMMPFLIPNHLPSPLPFPAFFLKQEEQPTETTCMAVMIQPVITP